MAVLHEMSGDFSPVPRIKCWQLMFQTTDMFTFVCDFGDVQADISTKDVI